MCFQTENDADYLGTTSPVCKEGNIVTSKIGGGIILKSFLNMDVDVSNLPEGNEKGISIETIVRVNGRIKEANEILRY